MLTDAQREFLANHHNGALTTFRRNGAAQMSIVTCGLHGDGVAFTTTADRAKLRNLRRDPRCTILVGTDDWRNFVVLEGEARLVGVDNSTPGEYRETLRDVYRTAAGQEHPNWPEYDQAMRDDGRYAVIVTPAHVYGRTD
ncbi:MAG: PPOX class F420-dependent oxidoreductase [Chloroflexi bacterium]|nr:PPOX class F420-dependent oxidoreductase [Chloroflexota bacterium]MYD49611.1 PPOX class F420-dependent oxidoreductase [Chloroflexota bacterium]